MDAYLHRFTEDIGKYDIISFDVFDTLLLRMCEEPDEIFAQVGKKMCQTVDNWRYSPVSYKTLRKEAAHRARVRKSRRDCSFEEIIAEMPFGERINNLLGRYEIECEKEAQFLNPNTYALLRRCAGQGKTIVLLSDMYFGKEQIYDFLACAGADIKLIKDCFVSSEYGCYKFDGKLFQVMLQSFPDVPPEKVAHIGDNFKADIEGAKIAGVSGLYYPVVPKALGSVYDFERYVFDVSLGELSSLRKLASATHSYDADAAAAVIHSLGAEVIGPIYALFAEWVIRYAEERGLKVILPFMREGELLSRVINRAIKASGLDMRCSPIYISRQPAFVGGINDDNYDVRISQALLRAGRALGCFFDELGLDIKSSPFHTYAQQTLDELRQNGAIKEFEDYLRWSQVRGEIIDYATTQRALLLEYLRQSTGGKPALTVDIGIKGTTERYLHEIRAIEPEMSELCHVLMMGSDASNADNILDGVDIVGWLGIAGENDKIIGKIKYQILAIEAFVNSTCGRVLRYEKQESHVYPVLGDEITPGGQNAMIAVCWEGVETFQKLWLSALAGKNGLKDALFQRKTDFLGMLRRFIETPTKEEASVLGQILYCDDFTSNRLSPLAGHLPAKSAKKRNDDEIEKYISAELGKGVYWPQAAVAASTPEYFYRTLLSRLDDGRAYGASLHIIDNIKRRRHKAGVIFGASELGRKFLAIAKLLDIHIICFVDSNAKLHGAIVDGLTICPLSEITCHVDYFVIASYVFAGEMRNMLNEKYPDADERPHIYDFGNRQS